jgi:hypothetical protein
MIIRSFGNGFEVSDYTQEVNIIPNSWGTIGNLGIFQDEPVAEHVVAFEEIIYNGAILVDRVRGDRGPKNKGQVRKVHTFAIPHFPLDDFISPQDLQGKRAYGAMDEAEQLAAVRMRKMERIRKAHADTLELARAQLITAGTVYSPSGTAALDWNAEFGWTRVSVDFVLGTSTTDVLEKIEAGLASLQDNANGQTHTGYVVLTSPEFFAKLIKHASVKQAYQYYTSTQEPLRQRLGGPLTKNRVFDFGGVTFVEMRDTAPNGARHIPANKAYLVPQGTDVFKTYFSPAQRFGLVNTLGEQVYMFETPDTKGTAIEIETESNFANALMMPSQVVEFTTSN